jgi:ATP-binding cassette subfamily B (MDR/TAP) protein 1
MISGKMEFQHSWFGYRRKQLVSCSVNILNPFRQIRDLQMATSQPLGFFIENIAAALAAVGIAEYYTWKLTLVLATSIPIAAGVLWLISRRLQPAIEAQKRALNEASKFADMAINAVDTVKVFNGQDHEVRQYVATIKKAAKLYMIQANANSLQMGFSRFLLIVLFVAGFWYGLVLYNEGGLTPGNVLTTFYSFLMANQAVELLLPQLLVLSKGMSAGETLKQIIGEMNDERRVSKITGSRRPTSCAGDIEVTKVNGAISQVVDLSLTITGYLRISLESEPTGT